MEDKDRFVNDLLDSALAQQRRAEPRAGFEGRILERVRVARRMRAGSRKRWLVVPTVAAAAAVLIAAIYLARRPHSPAVQTPQARNAVSAPEPSETLTANSGTTPKPAIATTVVEPRRTVHRERKTTHRVEAHHWPSQFPTPAPLTPEEKALVQYVRETPPQVLAASLSRAQSLNQPVKIKPLVIAPLEIKPMSVEAPNEEIQ